MTESFLSDAGEIAFYGKKKAYYGNVPCSFDIETSSTYIDGDKVGIMYIWMLGINGLTMIGSSWDEFVRVLLTISEKLELNDKRRIIIYVHNLEFEFQFMRRYFKWLEVFAIDERRPVYACTDIGIEFRCSYILSGSSLAQVGNDLQVYKAKKMVGDLDYSKVRHSGTPLSETELDYCLQDIIVVMCFIQEQIEKYGNITKLQLTKTGYVRKYCRDKCMFAEYGGHKKKTWKALNYRRIMESLSLEAWEYVMLKRAFQGGFTHANAYHADEICEGVESQDFTSSYPAVILMEKYPMSKGMEISVRTERQFRNLIDLYCCVFDIQFKGLIAKENAADHPLSKAKCWSLRGEIMEDNGRIIYAYDCKTTITDVDFRVLEQFYDWDEMRIGRFIRYRRGYLPHDFVEAVLKLYEDKTKLKGVAGEEEHYADAKSMLNACYGMMVTDIVRDQNMYAGDIWMQEKADLDSEIKKYNEDKKRFLFYPWGVFVTAYARKNLFTGISSIGANDYIYSDTDSVKYMHPESHTVYFEWYNREVERKLRKAMKYQKIDFERCQPETIKGVKKLIGVWDDEGKYSRFKTLGAKRYMTEKDGELSITVSGVNKKVAVPWLKECFADPFNEFSDDLIIPAHATGKMTHTYIDEPRDGYVTDYLGNTQHFHEESCIHLEGAEYSLSLTDAYIDLLLGLKERSK